MIKPKRSLHESHARARGQNRVLRRETEEDPSSDVDDDFPTDDFDTPAGLAARAPGPDLPRYNLIYERKLLLLHSTS